MIKVTHKETKEVKYVHPIDASGYQKTGKWDVEKPVDTNVSLAPAVVKPEVAEGVDDPRDAEAKAAAAKKIADDEKAAEEKKATDEADAKAAADLEAEEKARTEAKAKEDQAAKEADAKSAEDIKTAEAKEAEKPSSN